MSQRRNSHLNGAPRGGQRSRPIDAKVTVIHAFQSLQRQAAPPSKSLYVAAFALRPQGDTPPELGEYFWLMFPRFYFGLSEAERAPFARHAGAMLERFLQRAQNKEDLRHVALALHRLHFS